jgi:hypothetical protein
VDLLRRYVQAVEFWLPGKQKQDILAELSEDIRSEIEDKESEVGRPVGQTELEAILTRWGHPMLVAERYLPQRSLIGPVLLPAYRLVMTIVTLVYLLPWLLVGVGFVIFDPGHRTTGAIVDGLQSFWLIALHLVVVVTGIFALLERHQARSRSWENWSAGKLLERQPARDANEIPRSQSIAELVVGLISVWWWLQLMGRPAVYHLADTFRITVWPLYPGLYWTILVFLLAGVVMACVGLRRPWWTRQSAGAQLAVDALGLLVCVAIAASPFVEITAAKPREGVIELAKWANVSSYVTVGIVGLYFLARVIQDARRTAGKKPLRNVAITTFGAN